MMDELWVTPDPQTGRYRLAQGTRIEGINIPQGFAWDGASIPQIAWTVFGYTPFHPAVMKASLAHDYLYAEKQGRRKDADQLFRELLERDGVSPDVAGMMYAAVRSFGNMTWEDDEDRMWSEWEERRREEAP